MFQADGLLEKSGTGAATRLKLSPEAVASLKKFKAVARFVGKAQVAKNKNKRKRVVTPDDEARKENPDFALGLNMAKFKAAAVVVGKIARAPAKKAKKRASMVAARLARFEKGSV